MFQRIEQKLIQVRKATGIEIILLPGNKLSINTSTAVLKKSKIVQTESSIGLETLQELAGKVDHDVPLAVVINGKGVLVKQAGSEKANSSFQSVLPNANPSEFYFEKYSNNLITAISIIKKETFDRIINELKKADFRIIMVSLGISPLHNILPFLRTNKETELETDTFFITLNNKNEISDFRTKEEYKADRFQPEELLVADQYIKPSNLLSFGTAVSLLTEDLTSPPVIASPVILAERAEARYAKLFKALGTGILAFFFTVLLINFFVFNSVLHKNESLQASQFQNLEQLKENKKLEREVNRKEKFLERSGWTHTSKTSYYADRIASVTPQDVLLTSLNIYPARPNSSTGETNSFFKKDTIQISGTCDDPAGLNKFINNLKLLADFANVNLRNYRYLNDRESGSFLIETTAKE